MAFQDAEINSVSMDKGTIRTPIQPSEARRRIAQSNLKRCPLCNALNARANDDCFVCGWHGRFDHDPFRIEESLIKLIYQCPEFDAPAPRPETGMWTRLLAQFRRRIDLET